MDAVACHACGDLGGRGASEAEALSVALGHGYHVHAHGVYLEVYCARHRSLCDGCAPAEQTDPEATVAALSARPQATSAATRIARLPAMHPTHIVRSVRAHWQEEGGDVYVRAAVDDLSRRPGWDHGRAAFALSDVLEQLGLLAARAA